ncbi:hypothetical protein GQX74_011360 [Glossina fuscipes]|nr:hypothetical protein GQX74_011360 [Glossina fuscipes]
MRDHRTAAPVHPRSININSSSLFLVLRSNESNIIGNNNENNEHKICHLMSIYLQHRNIHEALVTLSANRCIENHNFFSSLLCCFALVIHVPANVCLGFKSSRLAIFDVVKICWISNPLNKFFCEITGLRINSPINDALPKKHKEVSNRQVGLGNELRRKLQCFHDGLQDAALKFAKTTKRVLSCDNSRKTGGFQLNVVWILVVAIYNKYTRLPDY